MDCDDTLEPTAYAEIIPILAEHSPDCLDFGLNYVNNQGQSAPKLHNVQKNTLLDLPILENLIFPPLLNLKKDDDHFVFDFACNKILLQSLLMVVSSMVLTQQTVRLKALEQTLLLKATLLLKQKLNLNLFML